MVAVNRKLKKKREGNVSNTDTEVVLTTTENRGRSLPCYFVVCIRYLKGALCVLVAEEGRKNTEQQLNTKKEDANAQMKADQTVLKPVSLLLDISMYIQVHNIVCKNTFTCLCRS